MRRATLKRCRIYKMLRTHAKKRHTSFHTPGHKRGRWDITELSFSDNLSSPHGCIADAEREIAATLGAHASFLLTDGSTSGVFCMLHAARALGVKKLAFSPLAHKSVYNACAVLGITPILLAQNYRDGIPRPLTAESFADADCDAVLITSPDYYGNIPDLFALRALCDRSGKYLLVDGAHGGHLHFDIRLYAGAYADFWVDGVHKSLPALTQGAVVSARTASGAEKLRAAADIFRTTSPSYPIMASVEYAVKYPRNTRLENAVRAFAAATDGVYQNDDWTKLCVRFQDAYAVEKALERKGVYAEFCDGNVLCFYLSPATKMREWRLLKKYILRFPRMSFSDKNDAQRIPAPVFLTDRPKKWTPLASAVGKIAAANIGLFPPCTPLALAGETVSRETIEKLERGEHAFGVYEGKILVYEDE